MQTIQNSNPGNRYDIYRHIHKALRAMMADTLVRLGRFDSTDDDEAASLMAQVQSMCAFTESHLRHEDDHVHPAMEKACPGSAGITTAEHPEHAEACRQLSTLAARLPGASFGARAVLATQLYQQVGLFMAECLEHMLMEETTNNQVLWAAYSDAQLHALEMEIVATLTPAEHGMTLQWMIPAMTPHERLAMLDGVRGGAPVQVFIGMMEALREPLGARQWQQLADALGYESQLLAA